ncbi:NAD(P)H-dependent flavin oxidoreductase [Arthrobacter cavernae]|uniref:Propionate 3-nitronate monooxygenase n=1 Tax=Arthrobacter cavernae TaxID=2817681 RepID=A0A939KN63_9MICC|nr:nitronate monooxygenase [Arthrobacter cavernae]MBO1267315.1 nitronate monooxygenase [Arthrobacter cavernae]
MTESLFGTPLIAAPMAGGTSTPHLVEAVHAAGGLGFLAAGYKSAEGMAAEIRAARDAGVRFGVNVFVPDAGLLADAGKAARAAATAGLEAYRAALLPEGRRYGVAIPELRLDDDDAWQAKIDALLAEPVEFASFAFGLPGAPVVRALQRAGTAVIASVTCAAEARLAVEQGADALVVQHGSAGGHTAAFLPEPQRLSRAGTTAELVAEVRAAVGIPLIAAGAIMDGAELRAILQEGAVAGQLGTALVRTEESGARQLHKDALANPHFTETAMTRAFTGRWARALVNEFVRDHADAPDGYPAIHHLTAPVRAAAAAAGDAERLNLWAGTGWREAKDGSVVAVVTEFLNGL